MKGPALSPWALVAGEVRVARVGGTVPMCERYMLAAEASVRPSAWAWAMRARAWRLA